LIRSEVLGEDSLYHSRHGRRSLLKAKTILSRIDSTSGTFLDVGCNQGVVSMELMSKLKGFDFTGIELQEGTLNKVLKDDPRFQLIEADVGKFSPINSYDYIFYGAVHHHIVRDYGFNRAAEVFFWLCAITNEKLFFETGHLTEGARWRWQECIAERFSSDEEHVHFLISLIQDRLVEFNVVASYKIHGVKRWLIEFVFDGTVQEPRFELYPTVRSNGRENQVLGSRNELSNYAVEVEYLKSGGVFHKRYLFSREAARLEYMIGNGLHYDWAVSPIRQGENEYVIEFPLIEGVSLKDLCEGTRVTKAIAAEIVAISRQLSVAIIPSEVAVKIGLHSRECNYLKVIDFNINNIIIDNQGRVKVVDFAFFKRDSKYRNYKNLHEIFLSLKARPVRRKLYLFLYFFHVNFLLVQNIFYRPERRVLQGLPSYASLLIIKVRNVVDRLLVKFFPSYREM